MFFTQEDYRKIEKWLLANSRKDTDFVGAATPLKGNETVVLVQNGKNVKTSVKDIVDQFFLLGVSDFLNITDKYGESYISLTQAIQLIPFRSRKEGQVITFLNTDGNWEIYQFIGKLNQWNNPTLWNNPFDWEKLIIDSILPDEEDLTKSLPDENGNSYLSLKDREYNPESFSGLGRVILRKNIVEVEDPIYGKVTKNILFQDMIAQANTIYEIRYDFDLNGAEITIPDECTLDFQGGSFSNGEIVGNNTKVSGNVIFPNSIILSSNFSINVVDVDWFIPRRLYGDNVDTYIQNAVNFANTIGATIIFGNNLSQGYLISKPININVPIDGNNATLISTNSDIFHASYGCNIKNINLSFYPYQGEPSILDVKNVSAITLGTSNITSHRTVIENVYIDGFYYGIVLNKVWNAQISNLCIRRTRIGIQSFGLSVNNSIVNTNIDCQGENSRCIKFNDEYSHIDDISEGWVINNSIFTSADIAIEGNKMSHVLLSNSIIDLCKYKCVRFTRNSVNIKLIGNYFACQDTGQHVIEFTAQNVLNDIDDGIVISENTIKSYYTSGNCSGIVFSSGTYECVFLSENTITSLQGGHGILIQGSIIKNLYITNNRLKLCKDYFSLIESEVDNKYIINLSDDNATVGNNSKLRIGDTTIVLNTEFPVIGKWRKGDIVLNSNTSINKSIGWICESSGTPGSWFPIGTLEQYAGLLKQGTTSQRPTVNISYLGACFFDTTLNKPIWFNGNNWVDATGATV